MSRRLRAVKAGIEREEGTGRSRRVHEGDRFALALISLTLDEGDAGEFLPLIAREGGERRFRATVRCTARGSSHLRRSRRS